MWVFSLRIQNLSSIGASEAGQTIFQRFSTSNLKLYNWILQLSCLSTLWAELRLCQPIRLLGEVTWPHMFWSHYSWVLCSHLTDLRNEGEGCWKVFEIRFQGFWQENVDVWWCFWGFGVEKRQTGFGAAFLGENLGILGYLNKSNRKHLIVRPYFTI